MKGAALLPWCAGLVDVSGAQFHFFCFRNDFFPLRRAPPSLPPPSRPFSVVFGACVSFQSPAAPSGLICRNLTHWSQSLLALA